MSMNPEMEAKYFTLEQANRSLPLVRRVVTDIVDEFAEWRDCVRAYELVAAGSTSRKTDTPQQERLRTEVDRSAHRINAYLGELSQIGCVLKGFEDGLVDFYSRHEDRDIFLCWKLGEPAVEHWHEIEGGYAGRQKITSAVSSE